MLIEIRDENGNVVLDNETKVLVKSEELFLPEGATAYIFEHGQPDGAWVTGNMALMEAYHTSSITKDLSTGVVTRYDCIPYLYRKGYRYTPPGIGQPWVSLNEGSGIKLAINCFCAFTSGYNNRTSRYTIRGKGIKICYLKQTIPADVSGYLDCYSPEGELTWSLNSLINLPKILKVIALSSKATIVNLNEFPAEIRDRIFFSTTEVGAFMSPMDYGSSVVNSGYSLGIDFFREGDKLYIGRNYEDGTASYIFIAHIP